MPRRRLRCGFLRPEAITSERSEAPHPLRALVCPIVLPVVPLRLPIGRRRGSIPRVRRGRIAIDWPGFGRRRSPPAFQLPRDSFRPLSDSLRPLSDSPRRAARHTSPIRETTETPTTPPTPPIL